MRTLATAMVALTAAVSATHAETNPLLPERRFENATLSDGSTWSSFAFTTVPGVVYRIESADALQTWTTELEVYGLGQEILIPMKELVPPSGSPLVYNEHVSLIVRPAAAPSTGMVLSWPSLDDGQALTYWIDRDFGAEWQSVPFSMAEAGGYSFAIFHPNDPAAAPATNSPLSTEDSAMVVAFEDNLASIESQLSAGSSTHTGEPPQDADKRFWRLSADWSVDSDGDGSYDWAEFKLAGDPNHPSHQWGDVFNADVDGDGTLDGQQADEDEDGVVDLVDARIGDAAVDWKWANHEPRHAAFLVEGISSQPGQPEHPLQTNDLGMVLYRKAVWVDGKVENLVLETPQVIGCLAMGMNNEGHVIGTGSLQGGATVGPNYGLVLVFWKCNKQPGNITWDDPVPAIITEGTPPAVEHRAQSVWNVNTLDPPENYPFDSHIDDKNRFVATTETWVDQLSPTYERSVWKWDEANDTFSRAPAESDNVTFTASADFIGSPDITWGISISGTEVYQGGQLESLGGEAMRLVYRPNNRLTAVMKTGRVLSRLNNGTWVQSTKKGSALDLSTSGVFLETSATLWANRWVKKFRDMVAPEVPAPWTEHTNRMFDMSPGNWLVAKQLFPVDDDYPVIASCPVIILDDDNEFATGVDVHSSTTRKTEESDPGTPSGGKYWIMVPSGPNAAANPNTTKFKIPGAQHLQITVSADGASPASTTLTADETLISWTSTSPGGTEIPLKFEIGVGANKQEAISKPVNLKVMKERELKVTIWHITLWANDGTHYPPQIQYEKADVIEELNRIYGKQANLWVSDSSVVMKPPQVVAYDQWHTNGGPKPEENKRLDYCGTHPTWEQEKILAGGRKDANAHINVYVVGGTDKIQRYLYEGPPDNNYIEPLGVNGIANRPLRDVWITGYSPLEGEQLEEEIRDKLRTLSHEIGHILIGGGHPNLGDGPAVYKTTKFMGSERLMFSPGYDQVSFGGEILLVKKEWDRIENSMNTIENGGTWPPPNENPK